MTESSSHKLNQRMQAFVLQAQNDLEANHHHNNGSSLQIEYFNDHDMMIEKCNYSDGIHYHPLQLPRMRLLAHTIHCLRQQQQKT